jgi:hypothetical protein
LSVPQLVQYQIALLLIRGRTFRWPEFDAAKWGLFVQFAEKCTGQRFEVSAIINTLLELGGPVQKAAG